MNEYIIINGELYHYGVPGMKWGVRKTRAERDAEYVKKWKQKQISRLHKESDRNAAIGAKQLDKRAAKYEKALNKHGLYHDPNVKTPATKAASKYIETKARIVAEERVLQEEAKKVVNMKLSDIKEENKKVGKAVAINALAGGIGAVAVSAVVGRPVIPVTVTDTDAVRRNSRVDAVTVQQIYKQAFEEAARDIYG